MGIMKEGIYENLTYQEYDEIDAMSGSCLFPIKKSPAHFWYAKNAEREDSSALIFGRAFHTYVLEYDRYLSDVIVCLGVKSRINKTYDAMVQDNPLKSVILEKERDMIHGMGDALQRNKTASKFLQDTKRELSIVWKCRETGVLCKGRIDAWNESLNLIIDVKTCGDASFFKFRNDAASYEYDLKAAWYAWGMYELGFKVEANVLIAVEKEAPFGVMNYVLDNNHLKLASFENAEMLKKYNCCKNLDDWPCYSDMAVDLSMPEWKTKDLTIRFGELLSEKVKNDTTN